MSGWLPRGRRSGNDRLCELWAHKSWMITPEGHCSLCHLDLFTSPRGTKRCRYFGDCCRCESQGLCLGPSRPVSCQRHDSATGQLGGLAGGRSRRHVPSQFSPRPRLYLWSSHCALPSACCCRKPSNGHSAPLCRGPACASRTLRPGLQQGWDSHTPPSQGWRSGEALPLPQLSPSASSLPVDEQRLSLPPMLILVPSLTARPGTPSSRRTDFFSELLSGGRRRRRAR